MTGAVGAVGLSGCATQTNALRAQAPLGLPLQAELTATPFFAQSALQCGPAALATVVVDALGANAAGVTPAALAAQIFLPARGGSLQVEMLAGARRHGGVATRIAGTLHSVLREVSAGHPVLVLLNLGLSWAPLWHYAVVVGYSLPAGEVVLRSGTVRREVMAMRTFEHTWARSNQWAFVVTRPGEWPATVQAAQALESALGFERVAVSVGAPADAVADAVAVYASALQRWPGELALAMGLGNTRFAAGDWAGAAQAFEAAARQHRSAAAWVNLGRTRWAMGQLDAALLAAEQALTLADPVWQPQAEALWRDVQQGLASGVKPAVPR